MSRLSIQSIFNNVEKTPEFAFGLDSSLTKARACELLNTLGVRYKCLTIAEVGAWLVTQGFPSLAWFCREHLFGFKLGFVLMLASQNRVFYSDSDVLWFSDFSTHLNRYTRHPIYPSIDASMESLDFDLVQLLDKRLGLQLGTPPYGCAGVMLVNRMGPHLLSQFEETVEIIRTNHSINRLSEQTLIAVVAAQCQAYLGEDTISMNAPNTTLLPSFLKNRWAGRHYAGPWRSQFWIDALWQQMPSLAFSATKNR